MDKEGSFSSAYSYFDSPKVPAAFYLLGYGLSLSHFQYSGLSYLTVFCRSDAAVDGSFNIKNNGRDEGAEIAEIYVGDSMQYSAPGEGAEGFAR